MNFGKIALVGVLTSFAIGCTDIKNTEEAATTDTEQEEPLSVIFMIGDGMGVPQVSSAFYFGEETPNFKQFTSLGLSRTSSSDYLITDSAAGATAFSIGEKTYKRAIGVTTDTVAKPTILEQLQDRGYATGLISLTAITHATPAAFYAHVPDRDMHEEIAMQLANANIDFLAGGGKKFFNKRTDGINLMDTLIAKNYHIDTVDLGKVDYKKSNAFLLAEDELPNKLKGRGDFLPDATKKALDYFDAKKKPFFMMVEGSFIDWGGHAKNDTMMIREVLDFDKTIGVVLDYVEKHPNTLVVITADHETGGVSLGKYYEMGADGKQHEVKDKIQVYFQDNQHSTELVPVFAKGKGEELFRGVYENNEIYHKFMQALNNTTHEK
ncbi:alkaline phosphatase [Neptunitalea chrysea]|uniref:Alkaline phosphatase n=2 Tax=Neptunitalea chrysea TaxID=1647581 RepID=A0A9W6EVI5_9FLAO|nr:alkaline phosphatase [Neptunitalea chrysea]